MAWSVPSQAGQQNQCHTANLRPGSAHIQKWQKKAGQPDKTQSTKPQSTHPKIQSVLEEEPMTWVTSGAVYQPKVSTAQVLSPVRLGRMWSRKEWLRNSSLTSDITTGQGYHENNHMTEETFGPSEAGKGRKIQENQPVHLAFCP